MYSVSQKNGLHLENCEVFYKSSINSKVLYILMKECFIPNDLVSFLCGMCSRLDDQDALFARVQESTCAKVAHVMFE